MRRIPATDRCAPEEREEVAAGGFQLRRQNVKQKSCPQLDGVNDHRPGQRRHRVAPYLPVISSMEIVRCVSSAPAAAL